MSIEDPTQISRKVFPPVLSQSVRLLVNAPADIRQAQDQLLVRGVRRGALLEGLVQIPALAQDFAHAFELLLPPPLPFGVVDCGAAWHFVCV